MLLMRKSTISMAIFNSYVSHYQRVTATSKCSMDHITSGAAPRISGFFISSCFFENKLPTSKRCITMVKNPKRYPNMAIFFNPPFQISFVDFPSSGIDSRHDVPMFYQRVAMITRWNPHFSIEEIELLVVPTAPWSPVEVRPAPAW